MGDVQRLTFCEGDESLNVKLVRVVQEEKSEVYFLRFVRKECNMSTYNKALQSLTEDDIHKISIKYLMGWHDLLKLYGFRVKGLNHRRKDLGLSELTKEWSNTYRLEYITSHFTYDEIYQTIFDYASHVRFSDKRWVGIELFDCRFGREYAKLFKTLLGNKVYRELSELCRVNKLMETQISQGGVGLANDITKLRAMTTNLERYGVKNVMQRPDIHFSSPFCQASVRKKAMTTKALNVRDGMVRYKKTGVMDIQMSNSELIVFDCLMKRFGANDVFYSYGLHPYDARYPFNCDFYIKSLDLFIELNLHYSHGKHWYDDNNHDDRLRLKHLLASDSKKSHDAVRVWTVTDVRKRQVAKQSSLHYLVFWDCNLLDFYKWFYDYDCNYVLFLNEHPKNTY